MWNAELPDVRARLAIDAGRTSEAYVDRLGETLLDPSYAARVTKRLIRASMCR
ncbi:hypothetical protein OG203_03275 [Nocardia sp. NBC_01499]|uniref:hypothetical protein n=1 Tax=Nocardia sp. NBC_01499 TaxID=2903597 RepID=UPI003869F064